MTQPRISLAMIVRNEGPRLAHCLESVKNGVDEIIIVDTGSSDDTLLIAKQYTKKVYSYQWNEDFAAARNYALQQTTCDWVLSLDADEQLCTESDDLRALITQSKYSAFSLPLCSLKAPQDHLEYDRFMALRLFQRGYFFKGAVHEYVAIEDPQKVGHASQPIIWHTPVSLTERRKRRGRNISLLKKALIQHPTDPYLQYYLGTEWLGVKRTDLAIAAFHHALPQFSPEQIVFRSPTVRHLISAYKQAGKLDEAICLCLQESQQYPEYCDLFFEGGVLFELKKEYEIGMKWFQEAVTLQPPPLPFFHTDGTNSYLAYYHLGYCAEKLGQYKKAEHYYEQALSLNKNFYYPLYQLVLLQLTKISPREVLTFLKEGGYLASPEVAEKMMELFWTAGFPDIGLQCIETAAALGANSLELLAKCQLYSGKIPLALQSITRLRENGLQPTTGVAVDEIIALLVVNRFAEARQQLFNFWKTSTNRDAFRAVFCLYKKLHHGTSLPLSNIKATTTLLDLQNRCLRIRGMSFHEQHCFAQLMKGVKDILAKDKDTLLLYIHDLHKQENQLLEKLDYTFTALRGLYHE